MQAVSFGNNYNNYYSNYYNNPQKTTPQEPRTLLDALDAYEEQYMGTQQSPSSNPQAYYRNQNYQRPSSNRSYQPPKRAKMPTWQKVGLVAAGVAAGVGGTTLVNTAQDAAANKPSYASYEVQPYDDIEEIAKNYNSDAQAIILYNGLRDDFSTYLGEEIKIPQLYDNVQSSIDTLKSKLFDKKLTTEERKEVTENLQALEAKQEGQKRAALCYSDGKNVYFRLNYSMPADFLKDLYGIKDGALRDNNDLEFDWGYNPDLDTHQYYQDYTYSWVYEGKTYKVPYSKVAHSFID